MYTFEVTIGELTVRTDQPGPIEAICYAVKRLVAMGVARAAITGAFENGKVQVYLSEVTVIVAGG